MSLNPQYIATPKAAAAVLSAANTARDGTGTIVTVLTAGAAGSRIDDLTITAQGTTTAGMIRFFLHDGTNARLLKELSVSAGVPSGTVPAFTTSLSNLAWCIPSGWSLRASTNNAESFNVLVTRAGDF